MSDEKRCETCKHWELQWERKRTSRCSKAHDLLVGDTDSLPPGGFGAYDFYGTEAVVITDAQFGCVLHELRYPNRGKQ